mmetsp:Transcript_72980/g.163359  ORF Transcript_72980/g.163359 Transcript_72980/m.163359 type:complete len:668 (-) Transcript_72980:145-2148(-)
MDEVFLPASSSTVLKTFLADNGFCDVNTERRSLGRSSCPLHLAVQQCDAGLVGALLEAGADPDRADSHGQTPRGLATRLNRQGSHDEILALLDACSLGGHVRRSSGAVGSADAANKGGGRPGKQLPAGPSEPSRTHFAARGPVKESARTGEAAPMHLGAQPRHPAAEAVGGPLPPRGHSKQEGSDAAALGPSPTVAYNRSSSPMKVQLPQERALPTLLQAEVRRHQFEPPAFAPEPRKREWDPAQPPQEAPTAAETSAYLRGPGAPLTPSMPQQPQQHRRRDQRQEQGGHGGSKGPAAGGFAGAEAGSTGAAAAAAAAVSSSLGLPFSVPNKPSRSVQSQLLMMAQDQRGSRQLQQQLGDAGAQDRARILEAVLPLTSRLACDLHGHEVVLQLFDLGTPEQRRSFAQRLRGSVLRLSKDRHGCWVVQKALETVPRDAQVQLTSEFEHHVCECVENMHGNFVIQKCIEQVPQESVPFIAREIEARVEGIAAHMYGCRAVQRLFEHCSPNQLLGIKEKIISSTSRLARDAYGNNVVRHLLDHGSEDDKRRIIQVIRSDVLEYAKNKSSSLVLEKCLEIVTSGEHARFLEEERAALMHELLEGRGGANPPVQQIMLDRFGNYIVQRLIERCRGEERELLRRRLLAAEPRLRRSSNGKHILAVVQREFGQL